MSEERLKKEKLWIGAVILAAFLCLLCAAKVAVDEFSELQAAFEASAVVTEEKQEERKTVATVKAGWKKGKKNIYYYNKKGQKAVGLTKIKGRYYYFKESGAMVKGWATIGEDKYYFKKAGKLGIMGSALIGPSKVKGKWYYFSRKGVLQHSNKKTGGKLYYITEKGILEGWREESDYYKSDGSKMTEEEKKDYTTFRTARNLVREITLDEMSREEKLQVCFDWVKDKPYVIYRQFEEKTGWPAVYANDHFKRKGGDSHADAAALAYLARALGYKDVYVCIGNDKKKQNHAWTEIDGKVYDSLYIMREGASKSRYYGGSYKNYDLTAAKKLKVAKGY